VFFLVSVAAVSVAYLAFAGLERVPALQFRRRSSPRPYLATDAAWYLTAIVATAISFFVFRPQLAKLGIGPVRDAIAGLPAVAQIALGLVLFDLVSFLVHVGLHRFDVLWNVHKVHHSSLQLDAFATARTHMFENLIRFVPGQAVLFVLGIPAPVVAATVVIAAAYGVSNHSNLASPFRGIEAVFVTPRLHRRHHVPATTQNNFGVMFTVWDRLLGTLVRLDTTPADHFGVPGETATYPQHFPAAFTQPARDLRGTSVPAAGPAG
jgi:sterol desaturase/sphingolipid hydroxylase (fatty acid hydroxylase superfamily)